jgi:hypothetical protein
MRRELIVVTLVAAACATAPTPATPPAHPAPAAAPAAASTPATVAAPAMPAAALADRSGDSPETAVTVPADAPDEGAEWVNRWIFDRYGRFRIQRSGVGRAGEGSALRRYKVVTIELPDQTKHTIFFDITDNWNAWQPN